MNKHVSSTVIPGGVAVPCSDAEPFDMARLCGRLCLLVAPRCCTVCGSSASPWAAKALCCSTPKTNSVPQDTDLTTLSEKTIPSLCSWPRRDAWGRYLFLLRRCLALRMALLRSMRRFSPLETNHLRFRSSPRMPLLATCLRNRLSKSSWDSPGLSWTLICHFSPPLLVSLLAVSSLPRQYGSRSCRTDKQKSRSSSCQILWGQQPRPTTTQTIPLCNETIPLFAPGDCRPHHNNTTTDNCQDQAGE